MRITNQMLVNRFLGDLNASLARAEKSQRALTSGKTVRRPSDDPMAASRALGLRELMAQSEQHGRNIESARAFLSSTATALQGIVDSLQRARELAIAGSSETLSAADLSALGNEAEQILHHAVGLGNAKYLSTYIFGGTDESAAPYVISGGPTLTVTGPVSPGTISREIDVGQQMVINIPGDTILPDAFAALIALRNAAVNGTSADVRACVNQIDAALDGLLGGLTSVGSKLNRLDAAEQRAADTQLTFEHLLSETEDTDLAETMIRLTTEQIAYQAALAIGAKIIQRTLIDYLR